MNCGHRILLVDDEPALLAAVRRVVARARPDAVVVYAADAATAEWQLRSTSLRLVVTDLRMSEDDRAGLRVVRAAAEAGVPVAVLTGADATQIEELCHGDIEVLPKASMTAARLAELVERAFR
ncbi:MAG: response regulator [Deltaproteobacteria bacterium]|nr:response regulator [Deltaproteobacteria bacterium]